MKQQILVLSEDLTMCAQIQKSLQDDFTDICCMTSARAAMVSYIKQDYCLIIFDVQLSNMDNMELLQTIHHTKYTPILVLSEPLKAEDKITIFHAGAVACLEKPIDLDIFAAQANALIRLYMTADINHEQDNSVIHSGKLIISPRYRRVIADGKTLELTRKEFDLLYCFAAHPEQVFTCEQLYDYIWTDGPAIAVDEVVKSQIKRLRRKLSLTGKNYIQNEWGVGYKFTLSDHKVFVD